MKIDNDVCEKAYKRLNLQNTQRYESIIACNRP